jgi:endo-1,4-beta-xylanase
MMNFASLALAAPALVTPPVSAKCDLDLEQQPPLRSHTRASGIKYGCAGHAPIVLSDHILFEKFATEANIFVPEGALKWSPTEQQPGQFDFSEGDSIADFATRNDMLIHGHTLVCTRQTRNGSRR